MKKWSLFLLTLVITFTLGACKTKTTTTNTNEAGTSKDYYGYYAGHYDTLNYLVTSSSSDNDLFANFIDGLVENDNYGNIIPSLATTWKSEMRDGKQVWTFNLRQGVKWVESDGKEYAEVTAQDWVDAANYILQPENESEVLFLMFLFIDGAEAYYNSLKEDTIADLDFSTVGVKAVDRYTLEYTLAKPAPYFLTALTYSVFFPINKAYLQDQGPIFGFSGKNILYNGAYILTEDIVDSRYTFTKNQNYWDKENVYINNVRLIYIPEDAGHDWYRLRYENNELTGFRLNENDEAGWTKYVVGPDKSGTKDNPYDPNAYNTLTTDQFTYYSAWNFNRTSFDGSSKTARQQEVAKLAILNSDFRLGFFHGVTRSEYLQRATPENPNQYVRNTFNPRELAIDNEGKDYIDYFAEVYAEKNNMSVEAATTKLADGSDAMYDKAKATSHFEAAKANLKANHGLTDADFPIIIETIASNNATTLLYYRAYADKFNNEFGQYAQMKLNIPTSDAQWREWSNSKLSYDLRFLLGWGPDYADPLTYLNTYIVQGDMIDYTNLSSENLALQKQLLGEFTDLVQAGDKFATIEEYPQRFRTFAEAEYKLLYEEALLIPFYSPNGSNVFISKTKPFTAMKANYGLSASKYKYMVVLDKAITREERNALKAEYDANRP